MKKIVILGNILEFQRGYDLTHNEMDNGSYPVEGSTSTIGFHSKYKTENSIVIGRSGTIGRPRLILGKFWPHNTALFTTNIKKNNLYYVYYLLLNLDIARMKSGSNIPTLNRNDLYLIHVVYETEYSKQEKIVSVLRAIDYQIKRNEDMVHKLQVLSQAIFNKFFALENDVVSLVEFPYVEILKLGIMKFDGNKHYVATAEVEGEKLNYDAPLIEYATRENRANMQPVKNSVWFAKLKNSIKHIYVSSEDDLLIHDYVFSTGFCGIKCDEIAFEYLINYLNLPYFEKEKDILSHGATMEGVNNEDLKSFKIHLPSKEKLSLFHDKTKNIHCQISKLNQMTYQLVCLKEKLLPLLINGQLQ